MLKEWRLSLFALLISAILVACGTDEGANDINGTDEGLLNVANENRDEGTTGSSSAQHNVQEFELEIRLSNKEKIEIEYNNRANSETAEIERETDNDEEEINGVEAVTEVNDMLTQASLQTETNPDDAIDQILSVLNISRDEVEDLDLEVEFDSGEKINGEI